MCKCGPAAHLAPDGSLSAPAGTNFKASCKSLHTERNTDDWCDSVCLAADGSHIDTAGGCDPEYCDCPWEQVAPLTETQTLPLSLSLSLSLSLTLTTGAGGAGAAGARHRQ